MECSALPPSCFNTIAFRSDKNLLLGTEVQLVVFSLIIDTKIIVNSLFLYSLLVNLPVLASLDNRFTYKKLNYFLEARNNNFDNFDINNLTNRVARKYWE